MLRSYPTLGPSGPVTLDVNGLAGSLELYFGNDVLRLSGDALTPIQWKGHVASVDAYQGEVLEKRSLRVAFNAKLAIARTEPRDSLSGDWSGMVTLFRQLFSAFP
jgi:hypothetical protein